MLSTQSIHVMTHSFLSKIHMIYTTNFRILHQQFRLGCFHIMCPMKIRHSNQRCPILMILTRYCDTRIWGTGNNTSFWPSVLAHAKIGANLVYDETFCNGWFQVGEYHCGTRNPRGFGSLYPFCRIWYAIYTIYLYRYIYMCVSSKQYGHFATLGFRFATLQANAYKPFYSFKHETHYWRRPNWNCIYACRERMGERER